MMKENKKLYGRDIVYIVDFVINIVLVIFVLMLYKNLYLKVGAGTIGYEVIMAGNGIPLIACMASIVTAFIEFIYGTLRLKGKEPDEIGAIKQWAMMWVVLKCGMLILAVVVAAVGVDLKAFLM